jgi:hypothetical protein
MRQIIRFALVGLLGLGASALLGCQTPTQAALGACGAGDQNACAAVPMYQRQEALELRRRAEIVRAMSAGAAIGGNIGRNLAGGGYTAPPIVVAPTQSLPPISCTSIALGGGMTTTNCN